MELLENAKKSNLIQIKRRYKEILATLDNIFAFEDICNDLQQKNINIIYY